LRAVLRQVLGFNTRRLFDVRVPYACLTRIEQQDGGPTRLVFHGGRLSEYKQLSDSKSRSP
jgi:hypothetical protein